MERYDQDGKDVNVRQTVTMIEERVRLITSKYLFEPNDLEAWTALKCEVDAFLNNLWEQGVLLGSKKEDAYEVTVGLGGTMTALDILEGRLIVRVLVSLQRPEEYIVITVMQQLPEA